MSKAKCPVCGRKGKPLGELYRCELGHLFDSEPDEGGSYHSDPSRRLEREEELQLASRRNAEGRGRASRNFRFGGRSRG